MNTAVSKVLVIDDEQDVCFIIRSMLKAAGFDCEVGGTVKQCKELMKSFDPDYVILDIDLPDGSGLEAIPEILDSKPETKVVMNSALDTEENRKVATDCGAFAFIGKPLNKKKILDVLA